MDAAEPAVDAADAHPVVPAVEDLAAAGGEGDPQRADGEPCAAGSRRRSGRGGRGELAQEAMEGEVAHVDPLLHRLRGAEDLLEGRGPVAPGAQDLPLGAREAVGDRGELLEVAAQGPGEEGEGGGVAARGSPRCPSGPGRGRPARRRAPRSFCPSSTRWRRGEEAWPSAGGVSCPRPWKGTTPGNSPMQISDSSVPPEVAAGEAVERADQQELVEQVVLEPEDDLVVGAEVLQGVVPAGEPGEAGVVVVVAALGEVAGAHLAPALRREAAGGRPLVQQVGGDRDSPPIAGDARRRGSLGRDVAVGDVEHPPRRRRARTPARRLRDAGRDAGRGRRRGGT